MPESKPEAAVLLRAAQEYLEGELLPTLAGHHRFRTRVTINALAMVRREIEMGATLDAEERGRLVALLGRDGTLRELNRDLADRIRSGALSLEDPALREHLRRSIAGALRISNPKWLGE